VRWVPLRGDRWFEDRNELLRGKKGEGEKFCEILGWRERGGVLTSTGGNKILERSH